MHDSSAFEGGHMFKKILRFTGFVLLLFLALGSLLSGGFLSFILFLGVAFWVSPFSDFLKTSFKYSKGKRIASIAGGIIAFLIAAGSIPSTGASSSEIPEPQLSAQVAETNEVVTERTLPTDELEAAELSSPADDGFNIVVADSSDDTVVEDSTIETSPLPSQSETVVNPEPDNQIVVSPSEPEVIPTADASVTQTVEPSPAVDNNQPTEQTVTGGNGGGTYNFDTYYIPENQQTTETWVLNTSTMRIHHPWCNDVVRIKPENYATSSLSQGELEAMGYKPCGHCFNN